MPAVQSNSGISLVEGLACVVILSIGIVAVYRPLLTSLSAVSYLETRGEANRLLENRIWEFKEQARTKRGLETQVHETLIGSRRTYLLEVRTIPLDSGENLKLCRSEFSLSWKAGGQMKRINRTIFTQVWIST